MTDKVTNETGQRFTSAMNRAVTKGPTVSDLKTRENKPIKEKVERYFNKLIKKEHYHKDFYQLYKKELLSFLNENKVLSVTGLYVESTS